MTQESLLQFNIAPSSKNADTELIAEIQESFNVKTPFLLNILHQRLLQAVVKTTFKCAMLVACFYTLKYVVKGQGTKLTETISLLHEACTAVKLHGSVADDAGTNLIRPAIHVLTKLINKQYCSYEFGIRLCAASLLGMEQFSFSHTFAFVFNRSAMVHLISIYKSDDDDDEQAQKMQDVAECFDESDGGLLILDDRNHLSIVPQHVDYAFRPMSLKKFNLMEFVCLTMKTAKRKSRSGHEERLDDLADFGVDADAIIGGKSISSCGWDFNQGHPQFKTHRIVLRRKVCIPVLAGKHIPSHPGPPPTTVSDDSKAHEWKTKS